MIYKPDEIPVCSECKELEQKLCAKCGIAYCYHYSSPTDIRFCHNCMADFAVVTEIETRVTEHKNANGDVTYRKRDIAKSLRLTGTDWLYSAAKISTLSDEEIEATIEYHKAIAGMMLMERQDRQTERYNKMSRTIIKLQKRDDVDATGALKAQPKKRTSSSTSTRTPKNDANAVADAMALLMKAGISREKLAQMLGGK